MAHWPEFDYVVVNDRFEQALEDLLVIVDDAASALLANRPEIAAWRQACWTARH